MVETYEEKELKQASTLLLEYDKDLLNELLDYLDKYQYDIDIKIYFLNAFKAIYEAYTRLKWYESLPSPNLFARQYLKILKNINKVDFVRDINNDEVFLNSIESIEIQKFIFGYKKDKNDHYIVTNSNPSYICIKNGYATRGGENIHILYDDASKYEDSRIHGVLFHELTHIEQVGFNLYWYIMNRSYFDKMLIEGHAMKMARQVKNPGIDGCNIPFNYNQENKQFEMFRHIDYHVYRYLYFKLEFLLGTDFMNEWATHTHSEYYLNLAYNKINSKFGNGTFERLYKDIQLILTALRGYINDKDTLFHELKEVEDFNKLFVMQKGKNIDKDYNDVNIILNDNEKLIEAYLKEKHYKIESKKYATLLKNDKIIDKIEQELNAFTEEVYRKNQQNTLLYLKHAKEAYQNYPLFRIITTIDKEVYNYSLNNPNNLSESVVDLESLMIDCILSQSDNKDQMLSNYNYNVFSNKFYCDPMLPINERLSSMTKKKNSLDVDDGAKRLLNKLYKS